MNLFSEKKTRNEISTANIYKYKCSWVCIIMLHNRKKNNINSLLKYDLSAWHETNWILTPFAAMGISARIHYMYIVENIRLEKRPDCGRYLSYNIFMSFDISLLLNFKSNILKWIGFHIQIYIYLYIQKYR